jgi:tetratricopeptide (TPR) repeat protein
MGTEADSAAPWLRAPRLWLAGLTITAFANATTNGFVWLDHWQVEGAGLIVRSWPEVWRALQQPLGAMPGWEGSAPYARPCVVLLLSLVHAVAGARPVAYHLTVELLHVANVLLVYRVLSALRIDSAVAFLTAALFAVHPLQTAAVSWVSGIADPLFTLFLLLALHLQLAASRDRRHLLWLRGGAVLCFVFAVGAKETAVIFPLLLAAAYLLLPGAWRATERRRGVLRAVAPFCVVLVGAAFYRLHVLEAAAFGQVRAASPLSVRLWTLPRLLLSYLTLPLRLGSLTVCDDYALSVGWNAATVVALVVVAVSCAGLVRFWRRSPTATFGVVWMLVGLVPVLNVVPILHYRADRFFYFPLIGWSLAFGVLVRGALHVLRRSAILSHQHLHRGATVATAVGLLALVALTMRRNAVFADDRALFESTLRVSPLCREAHTALGDAYLRAGRYADAATEYERARTPQPRRASYVVLPKVLINLGMADIGSGQYAAAEAAFTEAHRLQPQLLHPLFGLGIANLGLGQVATAASWLERASALAPDDPDVALNLALSYDRLGRETEALQAYRRYLAGAPVGRARALAEERVRALAASP